MSSVSDKAQDFLKEVLFNPNVPVNIKEGIRTRLSTPTAREVTLNNAIEVARDGSRPINVRLQALDTVIQFAKGEA